MKPMLATDANLELLTFPLLASAKLDGVRAIVKKGIVLSRTLKPIPNRFVQKAFNRFEHHDGELIIGGPTAHDCYRKTVSAVMSADKEVGREVAFHVFDHIAEPRAAYAERYEQLSHDPDMNVLRVGQILIESYSQLLETEEFYINQGHEGLMLRTMDAPYKFGRSTVKEGFLLKLKRFSDAEFRVVGFEERQHNTNEATKDELGRTKRSSHKAGKVGRGDLGALILQLPSGETFNCGTGFTDEERASIWKAQDKYLGQLAKIKYFAVGVKVAPRHPVWLGFRDRGDV